MKILTLALLCCLTFSVSATTYYVSPTGDDSRSATQAQDISTPWKTLLKAWSAVSAGDIIYLRGGTYAITSEQRISGKSGTASNMIKIWAYPGERPIFDFTNTTNQSPKSGLSSTNCNYIHVKGIRITGIKQYTSGYNYGMIIDQCSNWIVENCEFDHIGGDGFAMGANCNNNLILNCDAHSNADPLSPSPYDGSNGFSITNQTTGSGNIFRYCRSWWNSDDGFDTFKTMTFQTFDGCWSFWNGYLDGTFTTAGNGDGFKVGQAQSSSSSLLRMYQNCLAFENRFIGFDQNFTGTSLEFPVTLYNCTAYGNKNMGFFFSLTASNVLKNNLSFANGGGLSTSQANIGAQSSMANNSFPSNSVANGDFLSVSSTGMNGARQADGSLPVLNFMRLATSSKCVNAGVNVGLPFIGAAPDLGAFESGSASTGNQSPVANAGLDQTITLPASSVTLSGSATDPDGAIASYAWARISGPTTLNIGSAGAAQTLISSLIAGTYVFQLTVTDNLGATDKDTVQVTVKAPIVNQLPTANAGPDINITLPTLTVSLNGSGSDPDGSIASYSWSRISGPSLFSILSPASALTTVTSLIAGTYYFQLTVTDNSGGVDRDTVAVSVNAAPLPNQVPVANAGNDVAITLPTNSTTLTGNGSDADGTISSYKWTKVAGPTQYSIGSSNAAQTTITNLAEGTYQFQLTVTDDDGGTDADVVVVTVNPAPAPPPNQAPTANAGNNITITLPTNSVSLTGSGTDADGTIASYTWTRSSGPTQYTIVSPSSASTTINNLAQGTYQFQLKVTDDDGATATDVVIVTVNAAPVNQLPMANAGSNLTITLPTNSVSLSGTGTDNDGTIASYKWTRVSGPTTYNIVSSTSAQTTINGLVQGTYQFQLLVTDNSGGTGTDVVQVTVNPEPANVAPTANAGSNKTITLPTSSVSLTGSGADADGTISTYQWTWMSGPTQYNIASANNAQTTINNLTQGVYQFQLTVTDNDGATGTDVVVVTVNAAPNQAPTANAGTDLTIQLPTNSVTVNGSGSDADGTISSYAWTWVSGPTQYTIASASNAQSDITNLAQGTYQFQLQVTDNNGATGTDVITVKVNAAPANQLPSANAGADKTIQLPVNSVNIAGSGTDPDGTIVAYAWTRISGPNTYTIASASSAQTDINGLVQGNYTFQLKVTDNRGGTATDNVRITVNAAIPNQAPAANAGNNVTITLPVSSISLAGSGTDADGTIASYAWTKISGPAQFTINSAGAASTTIDNLVQGTYQFQLQVTDDDGATATDIVTVTVNAAIPNQAPSANAGNNKTITLPTNTVTLTGSGTDADGTIATYAWTKISGPTTFDIVSPAAAQTVINNLVQGTYQFQLLVTDDDGGTDADLVTVTVNAAAPNQAPAANAGSNKTITLPVNSVSLTGSGTDGDGTIASYSWTKISGPTQFTINSAGAASTTIDNLVQGTYQFQLQVTDDDGDTGTDNVTVTVNAAAPPPNQAPVANAGNNKTITLPTNTVTLTGSGTDADGTIATYAWTKISGPASFDIVSPSAAQTVINNLVQGTYQFQLLVTDDDGSTDADVVVVLVNPAPVNQLPVANAGSNKTITLPVNTVNVTGSGTDADGTIAGYAWTQISGPAQYSIASPASAQTSIDNLVAGTYQFELEVTDNDGGKGTDVVTVTVNTPANQDPTSNAGSDLTITLPVNTVTLKGTGTDPDGTISTYAWTRYSGPNQYNISTPDASQTDVTNLRQGTYYFQLRVTDNNGGTDADIVKVTVLAQPPNQAPVAEAGNNQTITLPTNSLTLNGSGTDADGTIATYAWTKIAGPAQFTIVSPATGQTQINNLVEGTYQFQLSVTDDDGATNTDVVIVVVNPAPAPPPNQNPFANAGNNRTITLPRDSLMLQGTGFDPDGTIASYQWTKISGPDTYTIVTPNSADTRVRGLIAGVYQFQLVVTDNNGGTDADVVIVTVNNAPVNQLPSAEAGPNKTITLPVNTVTVTGSGTDTDGTIAQYSWTKVSGPATFTIVSPGSAQTAINGLVEGTYEFELTVTDNDGGVGTDVVTVIVNPKAPNQNPNTFAGNNITITLPVNTVTLEGSATDNDGTIATYHWTELLGPDQLTIVKPDSATTQVTGLVEGTYYFLLQVTDNDGGASTDIVKVTVNPSPVNLLPVVNGGNDRTITLPTNSVTLTGAGTDPDGSIVSYTWTKVSGPIQFHIGSPNNPQSLMSGLVQGTYVFQVMVTDNSGGTATDVVTVVVNSAPIFNRPPTANAGPDITITMPTNAAVMQGSGTDPDGTIVTYAWSKISGPTSFAIVNANDASPRISNLVEGVYEFRLIVTDNSGATGQDTIRITVLPAPNQPPVANAGNDTTIVSGDPVELLGSGTDADGVVAGYSWTMVSGPTTTMHIADAESPVTEVTSLADGTYEFALTVTDNDRGKATDTVRITVLNIPATSVTLFPNPASSIVNLKILSKSSAPSESTLSIYDINGKLMYKESFMRGTQIMMKQVDITKYPNGTYIVSLNSGRELPFTTKLVKQ